MAEKTSIDIGGWLPGERLAIKALEVLEKIIDGQPPEVRERLWTLHLENTEWLHEAWRELWGIEKPKP